MNATINPATGKDYLQFLFAGFTLDIGGEGRHRKAWNLNPSRLKTIGANRGEFIPRLILGRADSIPLPDDGVDLVLVERTPLTIKAYSEICRIIHDRSTIVLRHALPPKYDPHRLALELLPGSVTQRRRTLRQGCWLLETVFCCGEAQRSGSQARFHRSEPQPTW